MDGKKIIKKHNIVRKIGAIRYMPSRWLAILKCPWADPWHTKPDHEHGPCPSCAYGFLPDIYDL